MRTPYEQGRAAWDAGLSRHANPFEDHTTSYFEWDNGWMALENANGDFIEEWNEDDYYRVRSEYED